MDVDERALLAAIIANPDEDTPRLIYADWLQEHDQFARAEFIRVAIELARLVVAAPGTPENVRYEVLTKRVRELSLAHARAWTAEVIAGLPPNRYTDFWYRRGFIGWVNCSPKYFTESASALVTAAPFERLSLDRQTPKALRTVGKNAHFKRFRGLRLDAGEITAEGIQPLLNSDLSHLRWFAVESHGVYANPPPEWANRNAELVERVAACRSLSGLDTLSLRSCGVGERGVAALAESPFLTQLRVLLLIGNGLSAAAQQRLRERFGSRVYFDFPDCCGRLTYSDIS